MSSSARLMSSMRSRIELIVMWLALSGVEPTPSHYKYNKTFHSAADFPQENPEVAIEANRCCATFLFNFHTV
jgi:hypothetical protein